MIPKKIHYIWVGGKPLNQLAEKCIASWKKYCPDYEIIRWDETNFDINQNQYCKEAYENKKWAFVSDYIRMKVLYEEGGVYMDTDVEVIKPLDEFLTLPAFSGFENDTMIPTGIIAAEKGSKWIKNLLSDYDNRHFVKEDGTLDITTNVTLITNKTKEMYPELELNNTYQQFESVTFYPKDYFCPKSQSDGKIRLTKNSYTIHHFSGSWVKKSVKFKAKIMQFIKRILGEKTVNKLKGKKENKNESTTSSSK